MKKQLFILVAICATLQCYGQTDELNLQKYWKFRNDFVQKYVKIGPQRGESLPVGVRQPLDCENNVVGAQEHKGMLSWGDGGVRQGHYLSLLATEYALRKKYNLDLEGIRSELYFALNAIERLDKFAESELDQLYGIDNFYPTEDLNGFFLRDDVPENFHLNWQNDAMDPKCVNASFYKNDNVAQLNDPVLGFVTENTTYQNTPSIDQIAYLLQGLTLVWKLVDHDTVTPPGMTQSKDLNQWAVDITQRILHYAYDHNWQIIDVNGWPVPNGGGELFYTAYPLSLTGARMLNVPFPQIPYPSLFKRKLTTRISKYQHCITGYGITGEPNTQQQACDDLLNGWLNFNNSTYLTLQDGVPAGLDNYQDNSFVQDYNNGSPFSFSITNADLIDFWTNLIPQDVPTWFADWEADNDLDFLGWPLDNIKFENGNYAVTIQILFNLSVTSGLIDSNDAKLWADSTGNYMLELSNAVINDLTPARTKSEYQAFLNDIDFAGPFSLSVADAYGYDQYEQTGGFNHEFRWTSNIEAQDDSYRKGVFNGLDYMIFHNLYYLLYDNNLPEYKEDFSCNCEQEVQYPIPSPQADPGQELRFVTMNKKLKSVYWCPKDAFEGTFNYIDANYQVNPQFLDYVDMGIPTHEFQMAPTTITENGSVDVNSKLVICGGNILTIESGGTSSGSLNANWADILIKSGASIDNSGNILIKDGRIIHIKEGAKLILRNGSELRIQEGGQLIIDGELEYYNGASIITEYDNAEIVLNGTIKMMDGGTFTCGNTPGQPTGRLVINSPEAKFSKAMNAGYCEVHLSGQNDDDEFLVLKKDASLKFMHNAVININKLTVSACKVLMEENSRIEVRQELSAYNAKFIASDLNQGVHIARANQFTAVDFQNVNIHANLNIIHGHKLRMTSCTMTNYTDGIDPNEPMIDVNGTGMIINNSTFIGPNLTYIYAENLNYPSIVSASTFNGINTGGPSIAIEDHSNAELKVFQNTFNNMKIGVQKLYDPVTAKCNTFNNSSHSDIGAVYGSNAIVTTDNYGGYNSFNSADATHGNVWLWYGDVDITNGRNYFNPSSDKHIYARMNYPCPNNLYCYINADNNQWNTGTQQPANNKFDVIGSDLSPISLEVNTTEVMPACGFYDGQYTTSTDILPNVTTSLGDLPLDKAIHFARQEMTINDSTANDEDALKLFDEIFRDSVLLDSFATRKWMFRALTDMKTALESEYYKQNILQESGQNPVMDYVNNYLNALNYMTPTTITVDNYRQAFHLELDKVQLYRMMEMPEDGLEILEETELCGLDSMEQEIVNYWKEQLLYDVLYAEWGLDILDTAINVDTRNFITPISSPASSYNFGTFFNSLTDRTYAQCSGGERFAQDETEEPSVVLGVYPVPADEVINITIKAEDGVLLNSIRLYDAMGRLMGEIELFMDQSEVRGYSIQSWSTGVYYYNVSGPSGTYGGGTFVVE